MAFPARPLALRCPKRARPADQARRQVYPAAGQHGTRDHSGVRGHLWQPSADRAAPLRADCLVARSAHPNPSASPAPRHQIEPRRDRAGVDIFVAGGKMALRPRSLREEAPSHLDVSVLGSGPWRKPWTDGNSLLGRPLPCAGRRSRGRSRTRSIASSGFRRNCSPIRSSRDFAKAFAHSTFWKGGITTSSFATRRAILQRSRPLFPRSSPRRSTWPCRAARRFSRCGR